MNSSGTRPPLIYFHGNFHGTGHSAISLAKLLGADQPLFVVVPHGTEDEPIPRSIETMAADRLRLILDAQPEGPYRLGGKCLGGIVAFEVARMLIADGNEVEMVVMLDPPTINARNLYSRFFRLWAGRGRSSAPSNARRPGRGLGVNSCRNCLRGSEDFGTIREPNKEPLYSDVGLR